MLLLLNKSTLALNQVLLKERDSASKAIGHQQWECRLANEKLNRLEAGVQQHEENMNRTAEQE